ncbi:ubiquinol-cytochrome-c reductase complex subunit-domain-containing protein [Talaromyces proteolyticus]|uniref:Ubiquinol-cytochrome-c reductase complex subunit-domain-containing protein n=1 Tax=Talaromyces proteolyticus TaxID=1131652 RepID=A0AAD4KM60_9EURO|nr:ubiquinol-cytochrome-c reductase complex subunit-domain-containing protein [Talaromyces proteolyticus]KAH8691305.1 ubiquinol-cytochrome-c reductase complex subunit-domain-containing protein [Talaromyces proteolyticus]
MSHAAQNLLVRSPYTQPYRSPYAPKYAIPTHWHGLTIAKATKYGVIAGGFGGALGLFALFFFGEVPRVRKDIFQKFPLLDRYFDRTIPPEDNPF